MAGGFFHTYQSGHNPKCFRRSLDANMCFMFNRKPRRRERVCYADIVNRLPRRISDRDMVMRVARAFASGYIDRDTMMRWIDADESVASP
jgi:hypothetical protein